MCSKQKKCYSSKSGSVFAVLRLACKSAKCRVETIDGEGATLTQLVTSDQFITGLLSEMVLKGNQELKLIDTIVDEKFERAYAELVDRMAEFDVEPDFSLITNPYHGDSETLRETLYAIRERGVVAINNPSFKTVEIKMTKPEAADFLKRSPLPHGFFSSLFEKYFSK